MGMSSLCCCDSGVCCYTGYGSPYAVEGEDGPRRRSWSRGRMKPARIHLLQPLAHPLEATDWRSWHSLTTTDSSHHPHTLPESRQPHPAARQHPPSLARRLALARPWDCTGRVTRGAHRADRASRTGGTHGEDEQRTTCLFGPPRLHRSPSSSRPARSLDWGLAAVHQRRLSD
ncbi:hypothetical protein BJY59DRAFT_442295 [Rhodotorula toruloides]